MKSDHYATLGIDRGATLAEVKSAYRKLALAVHPDHARGEADLARRTERFKDVGLAFEVLGDPDRRRLYDLGELDLEDFDFEPAGIDERCDLEVSFWVVVRGGRVELTTPRGRQVVVAVPAGAQHHQLLRLRGHGEPGSPPGDLFVRLVVGTDPEYSRGENDELHRVLRVTWLEAWRGDLLEVTTPWGNVGIELHAGVPNGQVYEVLAHGVRRPEHWGSLRLRIVVEPPPPREKLDPAVADALVDALRAAYDGRR